MTTRGRLWLAGVLAVLSVQALADTNPAPDAGDRVNNHLDRRGERIDERRDERGQQGDRFDRRFDRRHARRG